MSLLALCRCCLACRPASTCSALFLCFSNQSSLNFLRSLFGDGRTRSSSALITSRTLGARGGLCAARVCCSRMSCWCPTGSDGDRENVARRQRRASRCFSKERLAYLKMAGSLVIGDDLLRRIYTSNPTLCACMFFGLNSSSGVRNFIASFSGSAVSASFTPSGSSSFFF